MGGGGGGSPYGGGAKPQDLAERVRQSAQGIEKQQYIVDTSRLLDSLLLVANQRDADQIRDELDEVLSALHDEIQGSLRLVFGGSVAKHTYVDGLSDVDVLVILDKSELAEQSPADVRNYFAEQLREAFPDAEIRVGDLCVTVRFQHRQIQLLPAMKTESGYKIPEETGKGWSAINPRQFTDRLTSVNQACGQRLVPMIKLAKSIIADFPESRRLSGYHIEALATEIFTGYGGQIGKKDMLIHFFAEASQKVLQPIIDMAGQSVHIDTHLGKARSLPRQIVSDGLARIHRKMQNAEDFGQADQWESLFQAQLLRHAR